MGSDPKPGKKEKRRGSAIQNVTNVEDIVWYGGGTVVILAILVALPYVLWGSHPIVNLEVTDTEQVRSHRLFNSRFACVFRGFRRASVSDDRPLAPSSRLIGAIEVLRSQLGAVGGSHGVTWYRMVIFDGKTHTHTRARAHTHMHTHTHKYIANTVYDLRPLPLFTIKPAC